MRGSQALRLLTDYVQIARAEQTIAGRELQQLFAAHVYDLTAVLIGATRDAAEVARLVARADEGRVALRRWQEAVDELLSALFGS